MFDCKIINKQEQNQDFIFSFDYIQLEKNETEKREEQRHNRDEDAAALTALRQTSGLTGSSISPPGTDIAVRELSSGRLQKNRSVNQQMD